MTPDLNKKIREDYHDYSLGEIMLVLDESYKDVQKLIRRHSNNELLKKYFKWTGSTSLGAYMVSATSSHYDWAYKLIKKVKKDVYV